MPKGFFNGQNWPIILVGNKIEIQNFVELFKLNIKLDTCDIRKFFVGSNLYVTYLVHLSLLRTLSIILLLSTGQWYKCHININNIGRVSEMTLHWLVTGCGWTRGKHSTKPSWWDPRYQPRLPRLSPNPTAPAKHTSVTSASSRSPSQAGVGWTRLPS